MTQLTPELKTQIEKEAQEKADLWSQKMYGDITISAYRMGATNYAIKWQEAEEMMDRMAYTLMMAEVEITAMYKRLSILNSNILDMVKLSQTEYNNYKQTKDGTVNG